MNIVYSEFLEDLWLELHGELPAKGVYVDCGCYQPLLCSNTASLRAMGWTGIAIDANPALAPLWKDTGAAFVCAAIGDGSPIKFAVNEEKPAWSKSGSGEEIPTRTLESIMEEYGIGKIDLLSIDLEGMEYDALRTLNFEKHAPTWIIAEYDTQGIGKDYRVLEYLVKGDYIAMHMTEANIIFRLAFKQHIRKET